MSLYEDLYGTSDKIALKRGFYREGRRSAIFRAATREISRVNKTAAGKCFQNIDLEWTLADLERGSDSDPLQPGSASEGSGNECHEPTFWKYPMPRQIQLRRPRV